MHVDVEKAGTDDLARHVDHPRVGRRGKPRAHGADPAVHDRHVGDGIQVLREVDDAPAAQQQVVTHR